jgi:hypothetical protein
VLLAIALQDSPGSLIQGFNPAEIGLDGKPLGEIVVASSSFIILIATSVFFLHRFSYFDVVRRANYSDEELETGFHLLNYNSVSYLILPKL